MFIVVALSLLLSLLLAVVRALQGPTVFDRALAANAIGSAVIMLLAVLGFLTGRPDFLDIGLTFTLLNTTGTLAILKFWRYGDLSHVGEEPDD